MTWQKGRTGIAPHTIDRPILRGAKIKKILPFLLAVFLTTILTSGLLSRPTHAESFLYRMTCDVVGLLGIQCRPSTPPADPAPTNPAPTTQPSTTQPSTSSTPPSNNQTSSGATPTPSSSFTPLELPDASIEPVTPVSRDVPVTTRMPSRYAAYTFPGAADYGSGASVLGATIKAPLQSSPEGWKFFGISWYWLVLLVLVVFVTLRVVKNQLRRIHERANQKILKF